MKRSAYILAIVSFVFLSVFFLAAGSGADTCTSGQRVYNFTNNCPYTVWVGAANDVAGSITIKPSWKWKLSSGETQTTCAADATWSGRFWARTGCVFDGTLPYYPTCTQNSDCAAYNGVKPVCYQGVCVKQGCTTNDECSTFLTGSTGDPKAQCTNGYCFYNPACGSGDCNGTLQCSVSGDAPAILAEFTLGQAGSTVDNYDMSAADGMYGSVEIAPIPNTFQGTCNLNGCTQSSTDCPHPCTWGFPSTCPPELRIYSGPNVVGCNSPQIFCSNNIGCFSGGDACTSNSQCCSGTCSSGTCAAGSSIDCNKIHSIGAIACTGATDCPPVSGTPCDATESCPDGTTCTYVAGAGKSVCVMNCVSNKCKSVTCATDSDCAPDSGILHGQFMRCDLNASSATYQTCQPTSMSLYGCTGANFTSCKNTAPYGANATWCCGGAPWQTGVQAVNPTWNSVAEPFAQIFYDACSTAYSFPYDDNSIVLNTCLGNAGVGFGYNITFCPGSAGGQYKLTVTAGGKGGGAVTSTPAGINCGSTCMHSFASGAAITLTATAKAGFALDSWTGCDSYSGATCTVTMNSAKTVTAVFNKPPVIAVSPGGLNFGQVKEGVISAVKTVTVKNNGVGQLVVGTVSVEGSTAFLPANQCGGTPLDKGEHCQVTVAVQPTSFGQKSGKLNITSNDPKKPAATVNLSANAVPPKMAVSPGSVNFGTVKTTDVTKSITVKNTGVSDLVIVSVTPPTDSGSFMADASACVGQSIAKGKTCVITVTFEASTTPGAKTDQLVITPAAPVGAATVKLSGKKQ